MYTNGREHDSAVKRGLSATADSLPLARRRLSKAAFTARQTVTSGVISPSTTAELSGYTTYRCLSTPFWDRTGNSSPQGALGYFCGGAYALRHLTAEGLQGKLWVVVCWDGTEALTMHDLQAFEASNAGITAEMLEQLPPQLAAEVRAVLPTPQPSTSISRLPQQVRPGPALSTSHADPGPDSSAGPGPGRSHHMSRFSADFTQQLHSPSSSDMDIIRQFADNRFSISTSSGLWFETATAAPCPVAEAPEAPAALLAATDLGHPARLD